MRSATHGVPRMSTYTADMNRAGVDVIHAGSRDRPVTAA